MNNKAALPNTLMLFEVDLKRTERSDQQNEKFYWDEDFLVYTGHEKFNLAVILSRLSPSLKTSLKQSLISFTKQGDYAPNSYSSIFKALIATLNAHPTSIFDTDWIANALTKSVFQNYKRAITRFFLLWQECDSNAISLDALRLLNDTATPRKSQRNVLSDDPEKSWLSDEEYQSLLSDVWNNYDNGASSTQVTLIRLLSMQYARRPIQIAHLKVNDICESTGSDYQERLGRIIDFPGVKDMTAETGFRDSKFEPHPMADHLWELCHIQRQEVRTLYEHTLGFALTNDQLSKLPLFCSEVRIDEARQLITGHQKLNLIENLHSELFHLRSLVISKILRWSENTPTCSYGEARNQRSLRPEPPCSPRTGQLMVVSATRMRHTRARQLARQSVPKHTLSHWLGHTSEKSLDAYYNDPAEQARQLDEKMAQVLAPLAMAFTGALIDSEDQATRASDTTSKLEFASRGELKSVGSCGKYSFCATTSVPIPCYRCKYFEPLVDAPHQEVLEALVQRQTAEEQVLKIGGTRNLLLPIDLSADIRAVENCISRCNDRKTGRELNP